MIIDNHKNFRDRLSIDYQYQSINWYRLSSIVIDCHRLSISLIVQVLKLKDSGFLETLKYLFAWLKLVVSLNVLPNYISDLLFIVSCLLQFSLLCHFFSRPWTSLAGVLLHVSNVFLRLYISIKLSLKNKHNKLKCNYFKNSLQFGACQKLEPAGRIGNVGNFFNSFVKSPCVLWWSWILNECNLCWKIVKLTANCLRSVW